MILTDRHWGFPTTVKKKIKCEVVLKDFPVKCIYLVNKALLMEEAGESVFTPFPSSTAGFEPAWLLDCGGPATTGIKFLEVRKDCCWAEDNMDIVHDVTSRTFHW